MDDKVPNQIWVSRDYVANPNNYRRLLSDDIAFTRTDHVISTIRQQGERFTLTNDLVDAICEAVKESDNDL